MKNKIEKKYTILELEIVLDALNACKNKKNVKESSTILTGIRLDRQINTAIKSFYEDRDSLFKEYGVEKKATNVEGREVEVYQWDDKSEEEKMKIQNTIKELNKTEYSIKGFNSMTAEDFLNYTESLDEYPAARAQLFSYLVKEEEF